MKKNAFVKKNTRASSPAAGISAAGIGATAARLGTDSTLLLRIWSGCECTCSRNALTQGITDIGEGGEFGVNMDELVDEDGTVFGVVPIMGVDDDDEPPS